MSIEEITQEESANNGWQNQGKVDIWIHQQKDISFLQKALYLAISRFSVGYAQGVTKMLSYPEIVDYMGSSPPAISRAMSVLIEKEYIIKIATNRVVTREGKLPYRYSLNFKKDGFPKGIHTKSSAKGKSESKMDKGLVKTLLKTFRYQVLNNKPFTKEDKDNLDLLKKNGVNVDDIQEYLDKKLN